MGFFNHTCTLCKPSVREDCGMAPGCAQSGPHCRPVIEHCPPSMTAIAGNQSSCNHPQATLKRLLTFPHRRERRVTPASPEAQPCLPSLPAVCNSAPTADKLCVLGRARRYKVWKLTEGRLPFCSSGEAITHAGVRLGWHSCSGVPPGPCKQLLSHALKAVQ